MGQVVVVSRWFGGILLGPDRFKHINNAARSLLNTCGYIKGSGQSSSHTDKHKMLPKGAATKGMFQGLLFKCDLVFYLTIYVQGNDVDVDFLLLLVDTCGPLSHSNFDCLRVQNMERHLIEVWSLILIDSDSRNMF